MQPVPISPPHPPHLTPTLFPPSSHTHPLPTLLISHPPSSHPPHLTPTLFPPSHLTPTLFPPSSHTHPLPTLISHPPSSHPPHLTSPLSTLPISHPSPHPPHSFLLHRNALTLLSSDTQPAAGQRKVPFIQALRDNVL